MYFHKLKNSFQFRSNFLRKPEIFENRKCYIVFTIYSERIGSDLGNFGSSYILNTPSYIDENFLFIEH